MLVSRLSRFLALLARRGCILRLGRIVVMTVNTRLIATLFVCLGALGWTPQAPLNRVRTDISAISTALEAFKVDCGRYPSTGEGLDALLLGSTNTLGWHGPYARGAMITDLWKHRYVYRCPGRHNTNGFDLYTCGLDGVSRTDGSDPDDINNWDSASPHAGNYFNPESRHHYGFILMGIGILVIIYLASRSRRRFMGVGGKQ